MKKLGLVGGMGPESTIPYYRGIVYGVQEKGGLLSQPDGRKCQRLRCAGFLRPGGLRRPAAVSDRRH